MNERIIELNKFSSDYRYPLSVSRVMARTCIDAVRFSFPKPEKSVLRDFQTRQRPSVSTPESPLVPYMLNKLNRNLYQINDSTFLNNSTVCFLIRRRSQEHVFHFQVAVEKWLAPFLMNPVFSLLPARTGGYKSVMPLEKQKAAALCFNPGLPRRGWDLCNLCAVIAALTSG